MNYPETLCNLIECFKRLPGIGEKTAERLALSLVDSDDAMLELFSSSISNVKKKVKRCQQCHGFSETDICSLCSDESRNHSTICVVENPKDVISIERIGTYKGLYHVLDGLISPMNGKNPEDLNIKSLLERIKCGELSDILFIGTGALMNPMSVQQGQAIPGIAHLVRIKK